MSKSKSLIITSIAGVLLFCVLYLSSEHDIHWYNTFRTIFAIFGEVNALYLLYRWLREPSYEFDPKHVDVEVASGKTIPDSWINPFKIVKEKRKQNDTVNSRTTDDRSQDAGNKTAVPVYVSGRTLGAAGTGQRESPSKPVAEDSTAAS